MTEIPQSQMIIETWVTVKELKERIERHRMEDRQEHTNLWDAVKKGSEEIKNLSNRTTILESERTTLGKVGNFLISVFGGGAGAFAVIKAWLEGWHK